MRQLAAVYYVVDVFLGKLGSSGEMVHWLQDASVTVSQQRDVTSLQTC